jgi:hypothetical protein
VLTVGYWLLAHGIQPVPIKMLIKKYADTQLQKAKSLNNKLNQIIYASQDF